MFLRLLGLLAGFTDSYGLRYSRTIYRHGSRYIDVALNAWALYIASTFTDPARVQAAATLVGQWRSAMLRGLAERVQDAERYGRR